MSFKVEFSCQAAKELKRLDHTTIRGLEAKIDELAQAPFNPRLSRQMETDPDSRYSRVGDWRIIFQVNEAEKTLSIEAIRPRREPIDSRPDMTRRFHPPSSNSHS